MKLQVIATGSKGNCYALVGSRETLLIEAGVRLLEVKKALDFRVDNIVACAVSHSHGDHAKYAESYAKAGIQLYRPYMGDGKYYQFGEFQVAAFDLRHDVPCYGFAVRHPEMGCLIYASDTEYIPYRFGGATMPNHLLVEANYSRELIDRRDANADRVLMSHMELETTLKFIETNDNPGLCTVTLCHLSDRNADPVAFQAAAKDTLTRDIPVYIAEAGLTVELNRNQNRNN